MAFYVELDDFTKSRWDDERNELVPERRRLGPYLTKDEAVAQAEHDAGCGRPVIRVYEEDADGNPVGKEIRLGGKR